MANEPLIDDLESLITELVQTAPGRAPATVSRLLDTLRTITSAIHAPLALAIARIVELVDEDLVDPGIALPALASACATLVGGLEGRFGTQELEAARYEVDTLQPLPDGSSASPGSKVVITIPKSALTSRRRLN